MVTPLMATTLPTIVGMGVVSKTTDTMFGKSRKRRATTRATRATRTARAKSQVSSRKVHTGRQGGKYIMKKGRKIYI